MIIALRDINRRALERPPGYKAEVLAAGTVVGQNLDIPVEELRRLREKYQGLQPQAQPNGCPSCGSHHDE